MRHRASARFWQEYERLPEEIQRLADKSFELLKRDSKHPSIQLKKIGRFWSARVGSSYRVLGVHDGQDIVWFWIETHGEYDHLVG